MAQLVPRMDDVESNAWLRLVTILELLPTSLDAQLQQDSAMTHYEFVVLSLLRFAPDATLQSKELAARTNATLPRLSHVVSRMVDRGWVERLPSPGDRRATNVRLADDGRRAVVRATSGHIAHARRLVIDRLDRDELVALAAIGRKIADVLDPNARVFPSEPV
jgi:DNA-binding MarR family transcriptional regulator